MIKTDDFKIITGDELFIVEVNETNAKITISINNNTLSEVTGEDGIVKFKLPELDDGNYTITTTYNQTSIINTVQVNNLTRTIKKQNQTINKLKEDINTTETELQQVANKNKELTKQVADSKTELGTLKAQNTQLTNDLNSANQKVSDANAKISK